MLKIVIASAAALIATTSPAFAEGSKAELAPGATSSAMIVSKTTMPVASPVVAKRQRYCVIEPSVWSRVENRTCRTRLTWMTYGFDPLKK